MANPNKIIPWLIYQEDDHIKPGRIVDLNDGGGKTRFGITSRYFGQIMPANFFTDMEFAPAYAVAKQFYQNQHFRQIRGADINDNSVAAYLLSFAVNAGVIPSIKTLQHVLGVEQDGVIGIQTLWVLSTKDPAAVSSMFRAEWINYYHRVVDINPDKQRFLTEWISRAKFDYPNPIPSIYT